jgi:hypothetical protein
VTGKRYFTLTLMLCAVVLAPLVALNVVLGDRSLGDPETTRLASAWQQATRGATYAPPIMNNRAFKTLRLHDRLPEINTVVLGASTAFGITEAMFPEGMKVYNFSQAGNPLATYLGEAQYLRRHYSRRIKWIVVPLDWSIGFVFEKETPAEVDLAPEPTVAQLRVGEPPLHARLLDALSYPKMVMLGNVFRDALRAPDRWKALREVFLEKSSDEYACPDGTRARDFDVLYRGKCGGFYYDGSSTFAAWDRIRAGEVRSRVLIAAGPSSKYSQALASRGGHANMALLDAAARLDRELKKEGGGVIALLPPLIPGLEDLLARAGHSGASLARLKQTLNDWSARENIVLLDAGRSERFGCQPLEFLDEHHAMKECYGKVFAHFWGAPSVAVGTTTVPPAK